MFTIQAKDGIFYEFNGVRYKPTWDVGKSRTCGSRFTTLFEFVKERTLLQFCSGQVAYSPIYIDQVMPSKADESVNEHDSLRQSKDKFTGSTQKVTFWHLKFIS